MPSVYRPKLKSGADTGVWWLNYIDSAGRRHRESSGCALKRDALLILQERAGKAATGQPIVPRMDKVSYEDARADLLTHYEVRGSRDLEEAGYRLAHLDRRFAGWRLGAIGPAEVEAYARQRLEQGATAGTVNRELATLRTMLRLACDHGKLARVPKIGQLREAAPRSGFVTRPQFDAIARHLPLELQAAALVAFVYGWRKREILDLELRHLDLAAGTLRLDPGTTKNGEGRVVHLTPELREALIEQGARIRELEHKAERVTPWLFPHLEGPHAGHKMIDIRKAWDRACSAAGYPGLLFHDLRRSAVRNMEQASVPRSVAMKITGHKTESVYRRYAIVSDGDLRAASAKIAEASRGNLPDSRHVPVTLPAPAATSVSRNH